MRHSQAIGIIIVILSMQAVSGAAEEFGCARDLSQPTEREDARPHGLQGRGQSDIDVAPATLQRDMTLYVDARTVSDQLSSGAIMLVDIRAPAAFKQFWIPGSINLSPSRLKTSAFLKKKSLVLVDSGHRNHQLEQLQAGLKSAGFTDVRLLDGGLRAWQMRVSALAGDTVAARSVSRISARDFFAEQDYDHWVVLDIDHDVLNRTNRTNRTWALEVVDRLAALVERKQEAIAHAPYVLIRSADGSGYPLVEQALTDSHGATVFYLDGGRQAYDSYLRARRAMLSYVPMHDRRRGCGPVQ